MTKKSLILKHFQKKDLLTVKNKNYAKAVSDLFQWLTGNDQVKNDRTSKFLPAKKASSKIISHQKATVAGIEEMNFLLKKHTKLKFKPFKKDGQKIKKEEVLAEVSGNVQELLAYERTILNILQRLSGIATSTSSLISLISHISPISPINRPPTTDHRPPFIAATRKTPWGLLDKKAVSVGGGITHRLSLADGILIKDNHLQVTSKALEITLKALRHLEGSVNPSGKLVEIEVKTEKEAYTVIETFQKLGDKNHLAILFDNFFPSQSPLPCKFHEFTGPIILEASGGITEKNILSYAQTGVDIISLGSLTHSVKAANFSLEIK